MKSPTSRLLSAYNTGTPKECSLMPNLQCLYL